MAIKEAPNKKKNESKKLRPNEAHILNKKESIQYALEKQLGQRVVISLNGADSIGGMAVEGILRGYDSNVNLVISGAVQTFGVGDRRVQRQVGTTMIRGASVVSVMSPDAKTISNPYI